MTIFIYTNDLESAEHLKKSFIKVELIEWIDDLSDLDLVHDSFIVAALGNDIRANELLLRKLVLRDNRVLLLQRIPTLEAARFYLSSGIRGYGNVMMHPIYFEAAVETILSQMIWLHPEITARLIEEVVPKDERQFLTLLSQREQEIAILLLEGKTNHEIGEILDITPRTVKAHTSHIYQKVQAKDRLDFALRYK